MTDTEFIDKFLSIDQPMETKPIRNSSLILLLKGARSLSGRDVATGVYEASELNETNFTNGTYHSFQYTGIISYLIFLEQIGSIFKPKDQSNLNKTAIHWALKYFSALPAEKIAAIVSLRNSIAHKFGLATEKDPKTKPPKKFALSLEKNAAIVLLPLKNWIGDFSDKSDDTITTIFIHDLTDLVESVYQTLVTEIKKGNIEIALADGMDELKTRYTTVYG